MKHAAVLVCLALGLSSCAGDEPEGLMRTERAGGPLVRWDLGAKPLPEIPLPNDVATRLDSGSPTGRRVNVSLLAPTLLESDLRAKADRLDGFGVFQPITVSFERRLDLADIRARHRDLADPSDDVMYLLSVDPDSPDFGARVPLDLGSGVFPVVLEKTANYFENDPRAQAMNLIFDTVQEDRNCSGVLDPGEDSDFDGVLDRPNVVGLEWAEDKDCDGTLDLGEDFDCDGKIDMNPAIVDGLHEDLNCNGVLDPGEDQDCDGKLDAAPDLLTPDPGDKGSDFVLGEGESWNCAKVLETVAGLRLAREDRALADHLATFYELETETLIARPIRPLRQQTTYAVVLTRRLKDEQGKSVESPFPFVAHASQAKALARLPEVLGKHGIPMKEVAFAWTYTTGSVTFEMEQIRRGLYGDGPFAWLAEQYPVESLALERLRDDSDPQPFIARSEDFATPMQIVGAAADLGVDDIIDLDNVAHVVVGSFASPDFLVDRNGMASEGYPADDDEVFDIDPLTGEAVVGTGKVTFWCAVPREVEGVHQQPFPVLLFGHGYGSSKFELMSQMGRMARWGIATCSLDAFGHGTGPAATGTIDLGAGPQSIAKVAWDFFHQFQLGGFVAAVLLGRDRDLDNDGVGDPGGDFWTADTFHTRDMVRQSAVDHLQLVRILRSFDGKRTMGFDTDSDGFGDLAGDFDGDGRVDFGGPAVRYGMWGSSLGGILTGLLAGLEPALDTAAPHAGGAGLLDIGIRSRQGGVPEAVFMPLLGPMISFNPVAETSPVEVEIQFVINDVNHAGHFPFYRTSAIRPGDRVILRNLRNGEVHELTVPQSRRFRMAVPADALTATQKRLILGYAPAPVPGFAAPPDALEPPEDPFMPVVEDPEELGDPLAIEIVDGVSGKLLGTIDTFSQDVVYQGALHPAGSKLVALARGFAFPRNTPELRRMVGIASMIVQSADPFGYAPHYFRDPLTFDYDPGVVPGANVLDLPMVGDMNVPVNTGIMMAVAAGTVGIEEPDPRYGKSELSLLIDQHVMEGVERLGRYAFAVDSNPDKSCQFQTTAVRFGHYDADDLDQGTSEFHAPSPKTPLRATVRSKDGKRPEASEHCTEGSCGTVMRDSEGLNAMRLMYEHYQGAHDFGSPVKCRKFNNPLYAWNLIGHFVRSGGTELYDHPCLARDDCDFFPWKTGD